MLDLNPDRTQNMFGARDDGPIEIGFVLFERFHMMALTVAIEPLRVANNLWGKKLFSWALYSLDGQPKTASNEMELAVQGSIYEAKKSDIIFVCASFNPESQGDHKFFSWLRKREREGLLIGAIDTGTFVLAKAGLLNRCRATINYTDIAGTAEMFPDVTLTDHLYEIDGNKLTCAGGTAPMDLMLHVVRSHFGDELAARVCNHMFHDRMKPSAESQVDAVRHRGADLNIEIRRAIQVMERNLDTALPVSEIAAAANSSPRRLQRLFSRQFKMNPSHFYMRMRLDRARQYLWYTNQSVLSVSVAVGFTSQEHFARCFKKVYGRTPLEERAHHCEHTAGDIAPASAYDRKSHRPRGATELQGA